MSNIRLLGPNVNTCCGGIDPEVQAVQVLCQILSALKNIRDSEVVLLCDPGNSNAPVIVRYQFLTQASSQTQLAYDAWNVNGTPFTGNISSLVACGG